MEFKNLPYELKSKIMYSGYIVHPVAIIFKQFVKNILPISSNVDNNPSFIEHLTNIGELTIDEDIYILFFDFV